MRRFSAGETAHNRGFSARQSQFVSVNFTHLRGYLLNGFVWHVQCLKERVPLATLFSLAVVMIKQLALPATRVRRIALACILLLGVTAVAAQAGPRRARLSRDLVDRLARADAEATDVIVTGTEDQVRTLAARYGATVKKSLRSGAVLSLTAGQLDALSQDADVDHLSGDVPVIRMGVTTETIGAEQVWAGALEGVRGFTGRGVGVAIIDSGVWEHHKDLQKRVVVSVDFTGAKKADGDPYGHGTHVAGLIVGGGSEYPGVAPDASLDQPAGDGGRRLRPDQQRDRRARVGDRSPRRLQHPHHQYVARPPGARVVPRRSAVPGRAARGRCGHPRGGVGGEFRQDRRRPADRQRHRLAGQLAGGADGRGAQHQGHGAAVRRRDGDLQLARADVIDGVLKPELVAPGNKIVSTAASGLVPGRRYPGAGGRRAGAQRLHRDERHEHVGGGGVRRGGAAARGQPGADAGGSEDGAAVDQLRVAGAGLIEAGAGSLNIAAAVPWRRPDTSIRLCLLAARKSQA